MTKLPLPLFSLTVPSRRHMGTQPWPRLCTAENMEAMPCLCHEPLVTTIHLQIADCTTVKDGTRHPLPHTSYYKLMNHSELISSSWMYYNGVELFTQNTSFLIFHHMLQLLMWWWMGLGWTDQFVPGKTYGPAAACPKMRHIRCCCFYCSRCHLHKMGQNRLRDLPSYCLRFTWIPILKATFYRILRSELKM